MGLHFPQGLWDWAMIGTAGTADQQWPARCGIWADPVEFFHYAHHDWSQVCKNCEVLIITSETTHEDVLYARECGLSIRSTEGDDLDTLICRRCHLWIGDPTYYADPDVQRVSTQHDRSKCIEISAQTLHIPNGWRVLGGEWTPHRLPTSYELPTICDKWVERRDCFASDYVPKLSDMTDNGYSVCLDCFKGYCSCPQDVVRYSPFITEAID